MMKLKLLSFLICALSSLLILSGCGGINHPPQENALQQMLLEKFPENLECHFEEETVTFPIESFEIVRRQTYKDEKRDEAECFIKGSNENYAVTFNYKFISNFYDEGGWQLEELESMGIEVMPKTNTLPPERTESETDHLKEYYGDLTFVEEVFDSEDGTVTRKYTVDNQFEYLDVSGTVDITYRLIQYDAGLGEFSWVPNLLADQVANVKQTWKLGRGEYYTLSYSESPEIWGVDGHELYSSIERLEINNITEERIDISAYIHDYDSEYFTTYHTAYYKDITLNYIKYNNYTQQVFTSRDGSWINVGVDPVVGLYVEEYNHELNKTRRFIYEKSK